MKDLLCGVDLGGTKLAVVLTTQSGEIYDKCIVYDHATKSDREMAIYICDLITTLLARNTLHDTDLEGIGVCFPGHIRYKEGITITTSNLPGFKNFPLKQEIQKQFQTRVIVDNDANAQAYAEFLYGAGKTYRDMIFLTISSGIGGGIVINNRLYRGLTGTAGEFGHMIIDPYSTIRCGCGNYGCLMGCASGLSLSQVVQKYLDQGVATQLKLHSGEEMDGKMLKAGIEKHDDLCETVLAEYAEYIGIGVYNIFQIFNPPIIVLGGGLMNLGGQFLSKIHEKFRTLAKDMIFDDIEITVSQLGDGAGPIGAAALLLEGNERKRHGNE